MNGAEVFGEPEQRMLFGKTEVKQLVLGRIQQSVSGFWEGTHFPQDKSKWEHCSGEVWVSRGNQAQPEFCSGMDAPCVPPGPEKSYKKFPTGELNVSA